MSVQNLFLNQLRREATEINLLTINNETIKGIVRGFDNFCILLESEKKLLLIYKHALKSITPPKDFTLKPTTEKVSGKRG